MVIVFILQNHEQRKQKNAYQEYRKWDECNKRLKVRYIFKKSFPD